MEVKDNILCRPNKLHTQVFADRIAYTKIYGLRLKTFISRTRISNVNKGWKTPSNRVLGTRFGDHFMILGDLNLRSKYSNYRYNCPMEIC